MSAEDEYREAGWKWAKKMNKGWARVCLVINLIWFCFLMAILFAK